MSAALTYERGERADRVALRGEIDRLNADDLERAVLEAASDAVAVIVDLSAVSYLDSSGVRMLDGVVRGLGGRGVPLRLVAPPGGAVRLVLRIVAFGDELVADDVDGALVALG